MGSTVSNAFFKSIKTPQTYSNKGITDIISGVSSNKAT